MKYLILFLILISSVAAETMYYGLVMYKDIPFSNLDVTAHFTDINGTYKTIKTSTLTKDEAFIRNNIADTGYYFFDKGDINAKIGTNIVFTFSDYPYSIIIKPSKEASYRLNTISFDYGSAYGISQSDNSNSSETKEENEREYIKELIEGSNVSANLYEYEIKENNTTANYESNLLGKDDSEKERDIEKKIDENKENQFSEVFMAVLMISSAFVILFFIFAFAKTGIGYLSKNISFSKPESLVKKILKQKVIDVSNFSNFISKKDKVADTLSILADDELAFIVEDNYLGFIKMEDLFLVKDFDKTFSELSFHTEKIIIDSKKSIVDAFNIMRTSKCSKLCVIENEKPIKEVSISDLQKSINISKMNLGNIPSLRESLDKNIVTIKKGEKIEKAIELLKEKKSAILIVLEDGKIIGIFGMHEYVNGVIKYRNEVAKQNVESLMLSNFPKIDPDIDIIDANNILVEKGIKQIPVIVHGEIIGIVTDEKILHDLFKFITEL